MRIGILCPSEIAYRRFLPALKQIDDVIFAGVGVNSPYERYGDTLPGKEETAQMLERGKIKAGQMISGYGGRLFDSYESVVSAPDIDAVYIPLPPALHYKWAKRALECGKHVLVEKPSTISCADSKSLVGIASERELALHENYMFIFHDQLDAIEEVVNSGEIGDVRLYRISFGFPRRSADDFRYNRSLGGGALLDAGGYTLKYAARLLGDTAEFKYAVLDHTDDPEVDIYGSAALVNEAGVTAQIAFGMDNDYRCELEVWGSKGTLRAGRVFTAPAGFVPTMTIKKNTSVWEQPLPADDAFRKSIEYFVRCMTDKETREESYRAILKQARLMGRFHEMAMQVRSAAAAPVNRVNCEEGNV